MRTDPQPEYEDLGMEAIWEIEVEDFYANLAAQRPPALVQVKEQGGGNKRRLKAKKKRES